MLGEKKLGTNTRGRQGVPQKPLNAVWCRILRRQDSNPKTSPKNSNIVTTQRSPGHQQNDVSSSTVLVAQAKQRHSNKVQRVHSLQKDR